MTQKIAVAVVHGIGKQDAGFAAKIKRKLDERCRPTLGDDLVVEPVHWADQLGPIQDMLKERLERSGTIHFGRTRNFMIDFLADSIAYQPTETKHWAYINIHRVFAQTINKLADICGPDAPLCIVAHSLGTIITSNYIYDLQADKHKPIIHFGIRNVMNKERPIERGETLALLYTLGSPLALWSMRYENFGRPFAFPVPDLARHYPNLRGEWVNFYDADDIFGFPLKTLNDDYGRAVTADMQVNIGRFHESWNPLSHLRYWTDKDVVDPIAESLLRLWRTVNG